MLAPSARCAIGPAFSPRDSYDTVHITQIHSRPVGLGLVVVFVACKFPLVADPGGYQ
jgi:hypothetical protein